MSDPEGPFVVWEDQGYDGWSHTSYPTLKDAVKAQKYSSNFVIMKIVKYDVVDYDPFERRPNESPAEYFERLTGTPLSEYLERPA